MAAAIVAYLPRPHCQAADRWDVRVLTHAVGGWAEGIPSMAATGLGLAQTSDDDDPVAGRVGLPFLGPGQPRTSWGTFSGRATTGMHGQAWGVPTIGRMPVCGRCGEDNPERARFCLACGGSLAAYPAPQAGGAQRISVLFCDLVGFTSRSERLDVEDVRGLLAPYYQRLGPAWSAMGERWKNSSGMP